MSEVLKRYVKIDDSKALKVELKCLEGGIGVDTTRWVSMEKYLQVKSDCDKWYKLWLEECKKRKRIK